MTNVDLPNHENSKPRINLRSWFSLVGHVMFWGSFIAAYAGIMIRGQSKLAESGYQSIVGERISMQYIIDHLGLYTVTMICGLILLFVFRNIDQKASERVK